MGVPGRTAVQVQRVVAANGRFGGRRRQNQANGVVIVELNDILNGSQPVETPAVENQAEGAAPAPETPAAETQTTAQPRDEAGRFAPKGDTPAPAAPATEGQDPPAPSGDAQATAAPPAAEKQSIPEAALVEERRKRQSAEAALATLQQQLAAAGYQFQPIQPQAAPQPQLPAVPSVYSDEQGFADGLLSHAVHRAQETLAPQLNEQIVALKRDLQEELARTRLPDYDEKFQAFADMARGNPPLLHACAQAENPALFAYNYAKNAQQVQHIGSLDLDAIKAQVRAEIMAEQQAVVQPQPAPQIPTSLADVQSARPGVGATQAPPSLHDILSRK